MSTHPELSIRICLKSSFPWRRIEDSLWDNLVAGVCFSSRFDIVAICGSDKDKFSYVNNFLTDYESCVRK